MTGMEMKNMEKSLREINELEVKGLSDRLAVVHKGLQEVKSEPQVSLSFCWMDSGTYTEIRNTGGEARGDRLHFEFVE